MHRILLSTSFGTSQTMNCRVLHSMRGVGGKQSTDSDGVAFRPAFGVDACRRHWGAVGDSGLFLLLVFLFFVAIAARGRVALGRSVGFVVQPLFFLAVKYFAEFDSLALARRPLST